MENSENKSLISTGTSNLAKTEKLLSITQKILSEFKPQYESVRIGNQEWMTRNLVVDRFRNGDLIPHAESNEEWKKAGENGQPAWCYYDNDPENGKKYGKLYNWYAVNDPRGLAPKGWHVPTGLEWDILMYNLGGRDIASYKMKSVEGWEDWKDDDRKIQSGNGDNSSGLNVFPSRYRSHDGNFKADNKIAIFWEIGSKSIKEDSAPPSDFLYLKLFYSEFDYDDIYKQYGRSYYLPKIKNSSGLSIRCIAKPKFESIKIGNQEWMTKNLDVQRFRNGDLIPYKGSDEEWEKAALNGQPGWCYYDDYGPINIKNGLIYGKLYNWFAVNDPRGLAPEGWHVPTDKEWSELEAYLGEDSAGFKLKSKEKWGHSEDDNGNIQNGNGDNSSGLNCLPSGYRGKIRYFKDGVFQNISEYFYNINYGAYFWSATEKDKENAYFIKLSNYSNTLKMMSESKSFGASIRLIRD